MPELTSRVRTANGMKSFTPSGGHTLPHEHIIIDSRVWWEGQGDWRVFDDPAVVASTSMRDLAVLPQALTRENMILSDWYLGAREVRLAKDRGLQLLVDLTVLGSGPNAEMAVRAAELAGVDIVISVGRYLNDALPESEHPLREDTLVERWMRQITEGVYGYLPGLIGEIGTSAVIHDNEKTSLRAAATVQQLTGLPLNIHVHPFAKRALEAIAIVESAGADLSKVAISHLDCEIDLPQLEAILGTGVYVEMDNFGTSRTRKVEGIGYPDDSERVDALETLIGKGFQHRLLLSHDINHRNSLVSNGGWGYAHIGTNIIPTLTDRFGADVATQLVAENPLVFLHVDDEERLPDRRPSR